MLNRHIVRPYSVSLSLVFIITATSLTILFSILDQTGWAAVINCPSTPTDCNGTSGDDIMLGNYSGSFMHGLAGNDYMLGFGGPNYMWGDDGNDILLGSGVTTV
ncbi:MAG: hypothetical protein QOK59_07040 [Nitrososphaeraceae archaeon]|nr:hypothetical protein [Nitrososphaeraceae archaeon]